MRKVLFTFALLLFPSVIFPQLNDSLFTLSTGYNDRNPASPKFYSHNTFMFTDEGYFVFERASGDSVSNIMLQKITYDGITGEPLAITSGNGLNINPSISYITGTDFSHTVPRHILIVWQKFENGRWNIKGKSYNHNTGWSQEINVSSDTANEVVPRAINKDTTNFIITFDRGKDIIYMEFDLMTGTFSNKFNLTDYREDPCKNAFAFFKNNVTTVSYQEHWFDSASHTERQHVVYRESSSLNNWDTVQLVSNPYTGEINEGIIFDNFSRKFIFRITVLGVHRIFYRVIPEATQLIEFPYSFGIGDLSSYVETDVIITDASFFTCKGVVYSDLLSTNHSVTVFHGSQYVQRQILNATGNYKPILTVTEKLVSPTAIHCYRNWFIFNDRNISGSDPYQSRITGFQFTNCLADIVQTNELIPGKYELFQNYPNPFNPKTKITFAIPKTGQIKLTIFDALGREVRTLVNEILQPGTYETTFDASGLMSGVYFYRLETGGFSESKKLILVK